MFSGHLFYFFAILSGRSRTFSDEFCFSIPTLESSKLLLEKSLVLQSFSHAKLRDRSGGLFALGAKSGN